MACVTRDNNTIESSALSKVHFNTDNNTSSGLVTKSHNCLINSTGTGNVGNDQQQTDWIESKRQTKRNGKYGGSAIAKVRRRRHKRTCVMQHDLDDVGWWVARRCRHYFNWELGGVSVPMHLFITFVAVIGVKTSFLFVSNMSQGGRVLPQLYCKLIEIIK